MANENDYTLVLTNLQRLFDEAKNDGIYSFAPDRNISSVINHFKPAIELETNNLMFDILVDNVINDAITNKWCLLSTKCKYLYIIVPKEIQSIIESICCKINVSNYIVIPFVIVKKGKNRNVIFEF